MATLNQTVIVPQSPIAAGDVPQWNGSAWVNAPNTATAVAVIFDDAVPADKVNIRSDRASNQSPIDNTKVGITNLGSDASGPTAGVTSDYGTVGGGDSNTVDASSYGTIAGGQLNLIDTGSDLAAIGGGVSNEIHGAAFAFTGGGSGNIISGGGGSPYQVIAGGRDNTITTGTQSAICGGRANSIAPNSSFIGGGRDNSIAGGGTGFSAIAGGHTCVMTDSDNCFIGSGDTITMTDCTGGVVCGGLSNSMTTVCLQSTIGGGSTNTIANSNYSTIAGGINNSITTGVVAGSIEGGQNNTVSANYASASGFHSVAKRVGQRSQAGSTIGGTDGSAQSIELSLSGVSVAGAAVNLAFEGASEIVLDDQKAYALNVQVVANRADAAGRAMFVHDLLVHASAGAAVIDNDNITLSVPNGETWTFVVSVTGATLRLTGTGTAGQNVNFQAVVRGAELLGF